MNNLSKENRQSRPRQSRLRQSRLRQASIRFFGMRVLVSLVILPILFFANSSFAQDQKVGVEDDRNQEISQIQRSIIVELKEIMAECKKQKQGLQQIHANQKKDIDQREADLDKKLKRAQAMLDAQEQRILAKAEMLMDRYERLLKLEEKLQQKQQQVYDVNGGLHQVGLYGNGNINRNICVISTF